jgi:DsbC/DsbD-like thiol-disulfide interchange protein
LNVTVVNPHPFHSLHAACLAAVFAFLSLLSWAGPPSALAEEPPIAVRLVCEETALVPGTVAHLGVLFEIAPQWHLFWDGCNDTGYPIAISPELPPGFQARAAEWPAPLRLASAGDILDHVYEGRVMLILPVEVPADLAVGREVTLGARLEWVSCRDACEIGGDSVTIRLPVMARGGEVPAAAAGASAVSGPEVARLFAETRARVPHEDDREAIGWEWRDDTLVVRAQRARSIAFYPSEGCEHFVDILHDGASSASTAGGASNLLELRTRAVDGRPAAVRGVVEIQPADDGASAPRFINLDVPAPQGRADKLSN